VSDSELPWVQAVTITAAEGDEDDLAQAFADVVGPTRAEPGVLVYELSRSERDPRVFFFYEVYAGREAAKAHNATEHVQALGASEQVRRARFDVVKYRRLVG
jgi:quinol monooxygenase YgiN